MLFQRYFFLCLICFWCLPVWAQPDVQLAKVFSDSVDVEEYLVSEKYDGVRGIWTGSELLTRQGNKIHAPDWFTEGLPAVWLDGELWSERQSFEAILSTVSKDVPNDNEWKTIRYMVFDAPDKEKTFEKRYEFYKELITSLALEHISPVAQFSVSSIDALYRVLDEYVKAGAEGLILHRKAALFESGRSDNLLKLKPYMDAEAKVVGFLEGKGKYQGLMGALVVEMPDGVRFKIGTGFSDVERRNPPKLGEYVTYRYQGLTSRGIPRFASFLRVRDTSY
ncbi:DNA ligase [Marinomonas sp. C2222]|uniref:DNA ligase n=1 Tax=Marinomonas sargassi TaxID=2984494 RepID=A0ABT2YT03_9GAMM|nr:DNA ligase [Marinomonas sargassi]MCV2403012.1 DNA ligase [Marinomonas sargassi]